MAVARAIANGNWSSTSTWNGGVLPANGDTVAANGFTVTINQAVNIGGANNPSVNAGSFVTGQWYEITTVGTTAFTSIGASANTVGVVFQATGAGSGTGVATALATITTAAAGGSAAGGGFVMSAVQSTFDCDMRAGTTTCLNLSAATGTLSVSDIRIVVGTSSGAHGINVSSTANLTATSCTIGGATSSGSNAYYINNASTGTVALNSCAITTDGTSGNSYAVNNAAGGSVVIASSTLLATNGVILYNVAGGSISVSNSTLTSSANRQLIFNNGSGSISVTGCTVTNGPSSLNAIFNNAVGSIVVTASTLYASASGNAISNINSTAANISVSGILIGSTNGFAAIYAQKWKVGTSPTGSYIVQSLNGTSSTFTWYAADYSGFGQPAVGDVRSGTPYAAGSLTGTCAVPAAGSVAYGVPVDNTTGTAVLTASAVQSAVIPLL